MRHSYPKSEINLLTATENKVVTLRTEQIILPQSPKKQKNPPNDIIRLAASIKKYGILEPLTVREREGSAIRAEYELISGEKRLRAAISAGLCTVPVIVAPTSAKIHAISGIFEHLRQEKLHIFEQAAAYRILIEDFALTQEEIAEKIGVSQSAIANKLRLLQLSRAEQQKIIAAQLTERHARALLRLKNTERRAFALDQIAKHRLTVAESEQLIEEMGKETSTDRSNGESSTPVAVPNHEPTGVIPQKFALQSLAPLYNSINKTLAIFRKTGASATMYHQETTQGVQIVIEIPNARGN